MYTVLTNIFAGSQRLEECLCTANMILNHSKWTLVPLGGRVVSCTAGRSTGRGAQLFPRAASSVLTPSMSKSHYNLVVFLVAGIGKSPF